MWHYDWQAQPAALGPSPTESAPCASITIGAACRVPVQPWRWPGAPWPGPYRRTHAGYNAGRLPGFRSPAGKRPDGFRTETILAQGAAVWPTTQPHQGRRHTTPGTGRRPPTI